MFGWLSSRLLYRVSGRRIARCGGSRALDEHLQLNTLETGRQDPGRGDMPLFED